MPLAPFVRTGSGFHPTLDRDALLSFYHDAPLDVGNIASPSDLVGWEVLRERHGIVDPDAIPCDLFVWGTGIPPDLRLTRVGGTPWLPKETAWPSIDGMVLSFLCQFDFRDSRDLVGELPGDLLLIFVPEEDAILLGESDRMRFLWVSAAQTEPGEVGYGLPAAGLGCHQPPHLSFTRRLLASLDHRNSVGDALPRTRWWLPSAYSCREA